MLADKSNAQTRAKNKYNAKAYDSLKIVVKKGQKAEIKACAAKYGKSLNCFVNEAIYEKMKREIQKL